MLWLYKMTGGLVVVQMIGLVGFALATVAVQSASGSVFGAETGQQIGVAIPDPATQVLEALARRGDVVSMMALATSLSLGVLFWMTKEHIRSLREQVASVTRFSIEMQQLNERFSRFLRILETRPCLAKDAALVESIRTQKANED